MAEPVFGQTGAANEVVTTRFAKPPGWYSNSSSSVSKVSKASGHTVGPNSLLKVMAGDVLNAKADYYYQSPVTNNNNSLVTDVVTTLVQAIGSSTTTTSAVKSGTSGISSNLNGSTPFAGVTDPNRYTTDNIPRAYLNIVFFDERFNFVSENSTGVRVSQPGDGAAPLVLPANTKAPKNGYAYIYVSNENDDAVYFDNLQVSDNRGRIIEENHYYAFGLKIAGISSTKLPDANEGNINNKNLYNDKELIDEADLNWDDYGFRNYDAQIGRFPQLDPLTDDYPHYTPYQYAGNEPIANVDMDGLEELNVLGEAFKGAQHSVLATATVVGHAAPKVATGIGARLTRAIIVNAAKITADVVNYVSQSVDNIKTNVSNDAQKAREYFSESYDRMKTNLTPGSDYWKFLGSLVKPDPDNPFEMFGPPVALEVKEMEVLYKAYSGEQKLENGINAIRKFHLKDFATKNTKNYSAYYKSEREARNLARQKLGKNPIEVERNKFRSGDGKWQYRAKPGDISDKHIHLEELNPNTGEVLQNFHLRW